MKTSLLIDNQIIPLECTRIEHDGRFVHFISIFEQGKVIATHSYDDEASASTAYEKICQRLRKELYILDFSQAQFK